MVHLSQLVRQELTRRGHLRAKDLARRLQVGTSTVYRAIRILREGLIGIHLTGKGYIMSSEAGKPDDVGFLRRLNGRRTSDMVAILAARPHIERRWKTVEDRGRLKTALGGLVSSPRLLQKGVGMLRLVSGSVMGSKKKYL